MVRIREGERALEAERKKNKALRAETSGASKLSERVSELENEVKERDARIADILAEGEALSKKMGQVRKKIRFCVRGPMHIVFRTPLILPLLVCPLYCIKSGEAHCSFSRPPNCLTFHCR